MWSEQLTKDRFSFKQEGKYGIFSTSRFMHCYSSGARKDESKTLSFTSVHYPASSHGRANSRMLSVLRLVDAGVCMREKSPGFHSQHGDCRRFFLYRSIEFE